MVIYCDMWQSEEGPTTAYNAFNSSPVSQEDYDYLKDLTSSELVSKIDQECQTDVMVDSECQTEGDVVILSHITIAKLQTKVDQETQTILTELPVINDKYSIELIISHKEYDEFAKDIIIKRTDGFNINNLKYMMGEFVSSKYNSIWRYSDEGKYDIFSLEKYKLELGSGSIDSWTKLFKYFNIEYTQNKHYYDVTIDDVNILMFKEKSDIFDKYLKDDNRLIILLNNHPVIKNNIISMGQMAYFCGTSNIKLRCNDSQFSGRCRPSSALLDTHIKLVDNKWTLISSGIKIVSFDSGIFTEKRIFTE
jgi:hypothetical protein